MGGITGVARARESLHELKALRPVAPGGIRGPGDGRERGLAKDPTLLTEPEGLVGPTLSGDPISPKGKSRFSAAPSAAVSPRWRLSSDHVARRRGAERLSTGSH